LKLLAYAAKKILRHYVIPYWTQEEEWKCIGGFDSKLNTLSSLDFELIKFFSKLVILPEYVFRDGAVKLKEVLEDPNGFWTLKFLQQDLWGELAFDKYQISNS
jgi:hypothetical protein